GADDGGGEDDRRARPRRRQALLVLGGDAGAGGAADDDRLGEHLGGAGAEVGPRPSDLARLEAHLARARAERDDLSLDLQRVAGEARGEELDRVVGAEQALVAVGADEELGGGVAEEAEDARAVDEAAAVVGVVRGHAEPEARLHADLPSLRAM